MGGIEGKRFGGIGDLKKDIYIVHSAHEFLLSGKPSGNRWAVFLRLLKAVF